MCNNYAWGGGREIEGDEGVWRRSRGEGVSRVIEEGRE